QPRGALRLRNDDARGLQAVQLVQGPRLDQVLAGALLDALVLPAIEIRDIDSQLAAHVVEEYAAGSGALLGGRGGERRVQRRPLGRIGRKPVERDVVDLEESALLQVGRGDAPAAAKVEIEVVAEGIPESALGLLALYILDLGVPGVEREG